MARRKAPSSQTGVAPWRIAVPVAEIPPSGRRLEIVADPATRAMLAGIAKVDGIPRLELSVDLQRCGDDGVRVTGTVSATVAQTCVVSLEPMQNEVAETFDLTFVPPPAAGAAATEIAVDHDGEEPAEALQDGVVDVGAVAAEFLLLGIDPYPRKPGVAFDAPAAGEDPAAHPFAALAALKKPT